ncbi:MAG: DUF5697 family protein [Acutalibacteraceae bacterium]|nr:DUF5697 family protein [Acutalibacteraceae bacterium]
MFNYSEDEKNVLTWLKNYGPLKRTQIAKLLNKENPKSVEYILRRLRNARVIENVSGGYYIGLSKHDKADLKTISAMWVFLYFIGDVQPNHHRNGDFPGQIFFLKGEYEYQIVVLDPGLEFQLSLVNCPPDANRKFIIVVNDQKSLEKAKTYLPKKPCIFATLSYENGADSPTICFIKPEEAVEENAE